MFSFCFTLFFVKFICFFKDASIRLLAKDLLKLLKTIKTTPISASLQYYQSPMLSKINQFVSEIVPLEVPLVYDENSAKDNDYFKSDSSSNSSFLFSSSSSKTSSSSISVCCYFYFFFFFSFFNLTVVF
jgi:hypothetical protein